MKFEQLTTQEQRDLLDAALSSYSRQLEQSFDRAFPIGLGDRCKIEEHSFKLASIAIGANRTN